MEKWWMRTTAVWAEALATSLRLRVQSDIVARRRMFQAPSSAYLYIFRRLARATSICGLFLHAIPTSRFAPFLQANRLSRWNATYLPAESRREWRAER